MRTLKEVDEELSHFCSLHLVGISQFIKPKIPTKSFQGRAFHSSYLGEFRCLQYKQGKKRTCLCFDASCRPRENEKKDKRWMLLKLHTLFVFVWAAWLCAGVETSANVRKGERGLERRELQPGSFGVLKKKTHASSIKNCVRNRIQGMCRREDGEAMEGNNAALCTLTIHLNRNTEIPKKRIDVVSEVMKPSSSVFVNRGRDENARTGPVQSSPLLVAGITCWHEHDREMIHKTMIRSQSTNG